jgi:hypothetical protein
MGGRRRALEALNGRRQLQAMIADTFGFDRRIRSTGRRVLPPPRSAYLEYAVQRLQSVPRLVGLARRADFAQAYPGYVEHQIGAIKNELCA